MQWLTYEEVPIVIVNTTTTFTTMYHCPHTVHTLVE